MHVILEGVLSLHCKRLLVHCMFEQHYFMLKTVNRLISEFGYGYTEGRNIPRPLDNDHLRSSDGKLSQSGMTDKMWCVYAWTIASAWTFFPSSQMWLLGCLLPLIVGRYVPDDDAHWRCYMQLLRILTISTAIEVTEDTISILSFLIRDYLVAFNSLHPGSITPKLHYLLHLPRQMQL